MQNLISKHKVLMSAKGKNKVASENMQSSIPICNTDKHTM